MIFHMKNRCNSGTIFFSGSTRLSWLHSLPFIAKLPASIASISQSLRNMQTLLEFAFQCSSRLIGKGMTEVLLCAVSFKYEQIHPSWRALTMCSRSQISATPQCQI